MSQIFKPVTAAVVIPGNVPTSFPTDNGTATVVANMIEIRAIDVTDNNDNGIQTEGGLIQTGAVNRVQVQLTNRATGTNTTAAVETVTVISVDVSTITPALGEGLLFIQTDVIAYNGTLNTGASYHVEGALIFDGATGLSTVGTPVRDMIGDTAFFNVAQVTVGFSGSNIIVSATGSGGPVRWTGVLTYRFGGP